MVSVFRAFLQDVYKRQDVDKALSFDVLALGCPAMGDEELEEGEFEPFFSDLEGKLSGKKVALFGSYDWGDGEWMRTWCGRAKDAGAELVDDEGLIVNNTPDVYKRQSQYSMQR